MKYADEQIVRPQEENGCDYGSGRRSVLVRNGKKEILHCAGAKHWGGIGMERSYSNVEIVAYPVKGHGGSCMQRTLYPTDADLKALKEAGKTKVSIGRKQWEQIALEMFTHLEYAAGFDIGLISLKHTLLLDEPGEVDEPPPREPAPRVEHPRIESDTVCKVIHDEEDFKRLLLIEFPIVKQKGGKITYRLHNGHEIEKRTKDAIADGWGGNAEEAIAGYLRHYEEEVAEATGRLQRAASHYDYTNDNLIEAKNRIEVMRKEITPGP